EISRTSTFKELSEAESLALASALEAHANHPIARSFACFSNDEIIVTDVKNVIGSGIEGVWNGKTVKIGSSSFVLDSSTKESNAIYLSINNE
ncbi:hypothetical protein OFC49_31880, partial [Escherichia coli]|nr:hypothetical protein [Escherichia coli]